MELLLNIAHILIIIGIISLVFISRIAILKIKDFDIQLYNQISGEVDSSLGDDTQPITFKSEWNLYKCLYLNTGNLNKIVPYYQKAFMVIANLLILLVLINIFYAIN